MTTLQDRFTRRLCWSAGRLSGGVIEEQRPGGGLAGVEHPGDGAGTVIGGPGRAGHPGHHWPEYPAHQPLGRTWRARRLGCRRSAARRAAVPDAWHMRQTWARIHDYDHDLRPRIAAWRRNGFARPLRAEHGPVLDDHALRGRGRGRVRVRAPVLPQRLRKPSARPRRARRRAADAAGEPHGRLSNNCCTLGW